MRFVEGWPAAFQALREQRIRQGKSSGYGALGEVLGLDHMTVRRYALGLSAPANKLVVEGLLRRFAEHGIEVVLQAAEVER